MRIKVFAEIGGLKLSFPGGSKGLEQQQINANPRPSPPLPLCTYNQQTASWLRMMRKNTNM